MGVHSQSVLLVNILARRHLLYLKHLKIIVYHFQRHEQNLALPPIEKAALECVKAGLETWEYKAKNALMYYPEGKAYSQ